ncbi:glycosyltransferase family 4 protein [Blastopirellula marina]|uniref:glycosyltransferase family 4 protein n=1 Tax=Blastopirellula marina TaxID=124 RepID=UPI0011B06AB5|nr:glycosyltransferase family 1 protein [Blastopirellula marina]
MATTSKIWFDCSTVKQLGDYLPVGLSRLEVNALRGSLQLDADSVGYCVFDRYRRQFAEVSRDEVQGWVEKFGVSQFKGGDKPSGAAKRRSPLGRLSRAVERNCRVAARVSWGNAVGLFGGGTNLPPWTAGDVFALTGSTWDRLSERVLGQIVFDYGLQLAVVVSDMIPVLYPHQFHSQQVVAAFERFIEFVARNSALTLCISQSTKNDFDGFARRLGVTPRHSDVIYLGADPPPEAALLPAGLPAELETQPFVVSVSSIQVRKNHQLLYQLWRRFAEEGRTGVPRLVIVGAKGWLANDLVYQIERDPLVKDSIVILNHADDRQLQWLYANCQYTLYPSLYEGWGLPIVEGLMHGKACLASQTSSMPEASQGLAVHLDPLDFASWHRTIVQWSESPQLLADVSQRVQDRFQPRGWDDFGTEFCEKLQAIVKPASLSRAA